MRFCRFLLWNGVSTCTHQTPRCSHRLVTSVSSSASVIFHIEILSAIVLFRLSWVWAAGWRLGNLGAVGAAGTAGDSSGTPPVPEKHGLDLLI